LLSTLRSCIAPGMIPIQATSDSTFHNIRFLAWFLVALLGSTSASCRAPDGGAVSREALSAGIARALSQREELFISGVVRQSPIVVTTDVVHHRDGSVQLKVFEKDRPLYELDARNDETRKLMLVRERNHASGESLEYTVPVEEYYCDSYDLRMLGSISIGAFNGCLVGSDYESWLAPQSTLRAYLLEMVGQGRINLVSEGGRKLVLVQTDPIPEATHNFYFDAEQYLLLEWDTVFSDDPRLNRYRTFVYRDEDTEGPGAAVSSATR